MANTLKFGAGQWATKEGSTLAYNDENDNYKPLPFTFTRASNATVVNKAGLIETVGNGIPRIDFLGNTQGALKLEPQRTNLITYSEDFTNAIWTNTSSSTSVNPTADLSPNGNLTGNEFNEGTSSSVRGVFEDISVSANQSHTLSVFVKKGTSNLFRIVIAENGDALNWVALQVDLSDNSLTTDNGSNNSFTDISSSISDSDYNGYYRLTLTAKHTTVTSLRLLFNMTQSAILHYQGYGRSDYTGTNKTVFVWGCQLESNASYPTSYIPTQGSAVTRLADVCNNGANEQVINSTEGVLYFEGSSLFDTPDFDGIIRIENSSDATNQYIDFRYDTTQNRVQIVVRANGVNQTTSGVVIADTTVNNKFALKYKVNDIALWVNGAEEITVSSASVPTGLDNLLFNNKFYAKVKDIKLYNTALTDQELINLTTI